MPRSHLLRVVGCVPHLTPQCLCCQHLACHPHPSKRLLGSPVASVSSALEASCCVWEIAEGGWARLSEVCAQGNFVSSG